DGDDSTAAIPFTISFTLSTPLPITSPGVFDPDTCSTSLEPVLQCKEEIEFDPDGFSTGLSFISPRTMDANGSGGGFYFFAPEAFYTNGTYFVQSPSCCAGNA